MTSDQKGLKREEYISKDILESLINDGLNLPQIAETLNISIYKAKASLINADLFKGKKYAFVCEGCDGTFYHYSKNHKYCSNNCKHLHQKIWNRNKNKYTDSLVEQIANKKIGNTAGQSSEKFETIKLEKLNKEVKYNIRSPIEKQFLISIQNKPGLIDIDRFEDFIPYLDENNQLRHHRPDFLVTWESDIVWIVEIKGSLRIIDMLKCDAAQKFANDNNLQYRLYTQGFIKYDLWDKFYTYLNYCKIPSRQYVIMNNTVCTSHLSCSPSRKVGCTITNSSYDEIYSFGFNGDERGGSNVSESLTPGESGWIHAEENALLKLGSHQNCTMFLTDSPCDLCAKKIINSGKIKEVYYLREYRDLLGIGRLIQNDIKVYKFVTIGSRGENLTDDISYSFMSRCIQN